MASRAALFSALIDGGWCDQVSSKFMGNFRIEPQHDIVNQWKSVRKSTASKKPGKNNVTANN